MVIVCVGFDIFGVVLIGMVGGDMFVGVVVSMLCEVNEGFFKVWMESDGGFDLLDFSGN